MNERFLVRPMTTDDADVVIAGFNGLSPASLRFRFFSPVPRITPGIAADVTLVDPATRIVLLAFDRAGSGDGFNRGGDGDGDGRLVGGVRAVRHRHDPTTADVAVTVGDDHQRQGLGTKLLRAVAAEARRAGIDRLTGHVLVDNPAGRALLIRNGAMCRLDEPGVLAFEIPLARRTPRPVVAA